MSDTPRLRHLMESYFHQDYDLGGDDDAAIVAGFVRDADSHTVAATIAEIDGLLAEPVVGLLDRFRQRTGEWNMLIGDDDAAARDWLIAARQVLVATPVRPTPDAAQVPPPRSLTTRFGEAIWGRSATIATMEFPLLTDLAQRFLQRRDIYPDDAAAVADYVRTNWPATIANLLAECAAFASLPPMAAGRRWTKIAPDGPLLDSTAAQRRVAGIQRALQAGSHAD